MRIKTVEDEDFWGVTKREKQQEPDEMYESEWSDDDDDDSGGHMMPVADV